MPTPDHKPDPPLRWDERQGELRLGDPPPAGDGWPGWVKALALVLIAVALYAIGAAWMQQHPVDPADEDVADTTPAVRPTPPDLPPTLATRAPQAPAARITPSRAPAAVPAAEEATGRDSPVLVGKVTTVIDGDTLEVQLDSGPIRVRFESIDAPEHDQPLGAEARKALAARVRGQTVALEVWEQDQYGRLAAYVYLGEENVGLWLVEQGYAWAYHRYLHERSYCDAEFRARAAKRGLWALPEKDRRLPYEWRLHQSKGVAIRWSKHDDDTLEQCLAAVGKRDREKAKDAGAAPPRPQTLVDGSAAVDREQCRIKGNIGSNGQKIYHLPGGANYARTQINERTGERWFCTEAEARAAGWRAAKG